MRVRRPPLELAGVGLEVGLAAQQGSLALGQPALLRLQLGLAAAQGGVQLLECLGVRVACAAAALAVVGGRGANGPVEILAGVPLALLDLGLLALEHGALAGDRLLRIGQGGVLRLEIGLDPVGAHRQPGDVGLALAQLRFAQLHRVVAGVELALARVERVLAPVEPALAPGHVALVDSPAATRARAGRRRAG